jgi:hypothetical protein
MEDIYVVVGLYVLKPICMQIVWFESGRMIIEDDISSRVVCDSTRDVVALNPVSSA